MVASRSPQMSRDIQDGPAPGKGVDHVAPIFTKQIWDSLEPYQPSKSWIFVPPTQLMATSITKTGTKIDTKSMHTFFDKTPEEIEKARQLVKRAEEKKLRRAEVSEAMKLENMITRRELKNIHTLHEVYKHEKLSIAGRNAKMARLGGQRRKERAYKKRARRTVIRQNTHEIRILATLPVASNSTSGAWKRPGEDMVKRKKENHDFVIHDHIVDSVALLERLSISEVADQRPLLEKWSERAQALEGRNISSFAEALNVIVTKEDDQPFTAGADKFWRDRSFSQKGKNYDKNQKKRNAKKRKKQELADDPVKAAQAAKKEAEKAAELRCFTRKIVAKRVFEDGEDSEELSQSHSENLAHRKVLRARAKRSHATVSLFQAVFSAFVGMKNGEWTVATRDNDLIEIRKHDETKRVIPTIFAKKDIKYSQEIFRQVPVHYLPDGNDLSIEDHKEKHWFRQESYIAMLKTSNPEKHAQFMALREHCCCIQDGEFCRCTPLKKRFSTSYFWNLGIKPPGLYMYLVAGLIQHSCDANAVHAFTEKGCMVVAASRDIKAGEAITLSFMVEGSNYWDRKRDLKKLGITCQCKYCKQRLPHPLGNAMKEAAREIVIRDDPKVQPLSQLTTEEIRGREKLRLWFAEVEPNIVKLREDYIDAMFYMTPEVEEGFPRWGTKQQNEDGSFREKSPKEYFEEGYRQLVTGPGVPVILPDDMVVRSIKCDFIRLDKLAVKHWQNWTGRWRPGWTGWKKPVPKDLKEE